MNSSKAIETEITCLVRRLPEGYMSHPFEDIKQGYFSDGGDALRIRQKGPIFVLTKKEPTHENDFSQFNETSIVIKQVEFNRLWPLVTKSLVKRRYYYPLSTSITCEIDIFLEDLEGLILVEVEFLDRAELDNFVRPDWFGKEVTQEKWPSGEFLAGRDFAEVKKFITD
jgi:CYTH domain-containing protein